MGWRTECVTGLLTDDVLRIWETGRRCAPFERAGIALGAAWPNASQTQLEQLSVGEWNAALLQVHASVSGSSRMQARARCPACGETTEVEVDAQALLAAHRSPSTEATGRVLRLGAFRVEYRALTVADLISVASHQDVHAARAELVGRCVVSARRARSQVNVSDLPDEVVSRLADALGELDPLADAQIRVHCPACAHQWLPQLDVGGFVWRELASLAERVMLDVDALARAYGWSEADILNMHPARRQAYVEMAASG